MADTDESDFGGTGDSALATAVQPAGPNLAGIGNAPDVGLASPPSTPEEAPDIGAPTPGTGSNLAASVTPGKPDLPRFQRTFGNTLKGMLVGLGLGGLPGAVVGGINPQGIQREAQSRAAIAAANQHFASARAAHETLQASLLEKQVNAFDEQHQAEMERIGLENLDAAQKAGFKIVSVTPLDSNPADNTKAAMNNLQQIQKNNGGKVPEGLLHIHAGNGNGIYTLQLQDPAAALGIVNQTRRAQGLPELDSNTFMGLSPQERQSQAKDAINFTNPTDPQTGQISQTSVTTLENRLALVKAQPAFNGQDALAASLQQNLDFQKSALEHEATRKGQATGAEALGAQPGKTAAEVANVNATAGPEARAAGLKAGAEEAAKFPWEARLEQMKQQGDPVFAFDPQNKQTVQVSRGEAVAKGFTNIVKVNEGEIDKAKTSAMQLGDATMNIQAYKQAAQRMDELSGPEIASVSRIIGDDKFKAHFLGLELPVDWANQLYQTRGWQELPESAKDAVVNYIAARPAAISLLRAINPGVRLTESQIATELKNIPSPTTPSDIRDKQFARLDRNIDQASKTLVKVPGVDLPSEIREHLGTQQNVQDVGKANASAAEAAQTGQYKNAGGFRLQVGHDVYVDKHYIGKVSKVYQDGSYDVQPD
jgi:hypothetical protein